MMLDEKSLCKSKPNFNFFFESLPEAMIDDAQFGVMYLPLLHEYAVFFFRKP